jgi:DNA invertase Pin-like site-specific DNA recombinase
LRGALYPHESGSYAGRLPSEVEALTDLVASYGIVIAPEDVFTDIAGERDADRPGLAALRASVGDGPSGPLVIVTQVAKLTRDARFKLELLTEFERAGVRLVLNVEPLPPSAPSA